MPRRRRQLVARLLLLAFLAGMLGTVEWRSADVAEAAEPFSFRDSVLETGPAAYWGLGETSGNAVDHAGSFTGSFVPGSAGAFERGAPGAPVEGKWDEAIRIQDASSLGGGGGSGGYVATPYPGRWAGRGAFTLNLWLRWDGVNPNHGPSAQGIAGTLMGAPYFVGWSLYLPPTDPRLNFFRDSSQPGVASPTPLPKGEWVMATVSYDGLTSRLYENGELVAAATDTSYLGGRASLTIGRQDFNNFLSGYWGYFNGAIDEVAVWERALSDAEVADIFPPSEAPLLRQTLGAPGGSLGVNPSGYFADPVNSLTGSFWHEELDVSSPGLGVPFTFSRTYNSLDDRPGPFGQGWTHSYAETLEFETNGDALVRAGDGQQIRFERQADGSFTGGPGARATLSAVAGGYDLRTYAQELHRFDTAGRLIALLDRNGKGLSLSYDPSDRLATVVDNASRTARFAYNADGTVAALALSDGRQVQYAYEAGRLVAVTDVRGGVVRYRYDAQGRLDRIVDQNGNATVTNVYSADGKVASQTDALGETTTFTWDSSTQTATATDARGNRWQDVYDGVKLVRQVDPLGNATRFEYDTDLNVTRLVDARGNAVASSYDARGNPLSISNALGQTALFSWSERNDPLAATDPRGNRTSYEYNPAGNLTRVTAPGQSSTTFTIDAQTGLPSALTDARGASTTFAYDAAGSPTMVTSPLGARATFEYDSAGRLSASIDPRGNETGAAAADYRTAYVYDAAGNPVRETDPLGNVTESAYDAAGNLTSRTDANGRTTAFAYDPANRLVRVTAPDGSVTAYTYDGVDNLTSRTDANGRVTRYLYDAANRLVEVVDPLQRRWTYEYDANGNLVASTDANGNVTTEPGDGRTRYEYDALDRLVAIDYSDATPDVVHSYDANGNRTEMRDAFGVEMYAYDERDRLVAVTRGAETFTYAYDANSNLIRRTYPDGSVFTYAYDDENRLSSVTAPDGTTGYSYDPAGNLVRTQLPAANGHWQTRTYDRAGRLVELRNQNAQKTISYAGYTLDPVGNPLRMLTKPDDGQLGETDANQQATTYAYDARDRLTEVCFRSNCAGASDPFIRWSYDAVGNRLTETRDSGATTYAYDAADQLLSQAGLGGAKTYGYDSNGSQTRAGERSFVYDQANRLISTTFAGETTDYGYDGDGKRLRAGETSFLWDVANGLPELALERDSGGATLRRYAYGTELLSMRAGGEERYFHTDALGGVLNTSSASGKLEWSYSYEPYGTVRRDLRHGSNSAENPIRFTGAYQDPTGLYHLRARQYDSTTGRFNATDPLAPLLTDPFISSYVYANNLPTALVDPSGLGAVRPRRALQSAGAARRIPTLIYSAEVLLKQRAAELAARTRAPNADWGHAFSFLLDRQILLAARLVPYPSRDPRAKAGYVQFETIGTLTISRRIGRVWSNERRSGCFEIGGYFVGAKRTHFRVTHRFFDFRRPGCQ